MRKPVGTGQSDKGIPIVVCDDGSAWLYWQGENEWQKIAPRPWNRGRRHPRTG